MKNKYYNGSFDIINIDYDEILKDFNIFKIDIDLEIFYGELIDNKERSEFFKFIREIKNLDSFYLKESLFLLGNKKCKVEKYNFFKSYIRGGVQRLGTKKELENVDKLILLNLLIKYIPIKIFKDDTKKEVKYIDNKPLHLFIKEKDKIFRFFRVSFEKSEINKKYLLNLLQVTFAHEKHFIDQSKLKLRKATKIGFDPVTRVLIPNENGKYYDRSPNKKIESLFITTIHDDVERFRSYYFTLVKDIIDEYLSKYIVLNFETLKDFEVYNPIIKKNYFQNRIKELKKDINIYRIKDFDIEGKELIAKDDFKELENYCKNFKAKETTYKFEKINLIDRGVATIDTKYQENSWNILLLNNATGQQLDYDGYKEIKRNLNIISNGLCLENIEDKDKEKIVRIKMLRIIEELFIKDSIKNRNIKGLYSDINIFKGVSCLHYFDKRIRKIKVLSNGKIKIQSSMIYNDDKLNTEFFKLIKKFDLEEKIKNDENKKKSNLNLKFIKINKKDIYIVETGMRLYFNTDEYLEEEKLSKNKDGFLGVSIGVKFNYKENLYYSFYDTGIKSKLTFSPNIKKLICKEKLTQDEYSIFCESLIFKYLSNSNKLATYPFFFKLTSEILKDCHD